MNWKLVGLAIVGGLIAKKVLSSKDKKICRKSENDCEDYREDYSERQSEVVRQKAKEELYQIRIKGTIQCNGPKIINKTFIGDKVQAQMFSGCRRYEAIEGWIRANYPAAKPQENYHGFGVEVKPLK